MEEDGIEGVEGKVGEGRGGEGDGDQGEMARYDIVGKGIRGLKGSM